MFYCSLLLVLACLQSFTMAQRYAVTDQCTKSGVIFTLKGGQLVCADPDQMWVKNLKNRIDERLSYSQAHIGKHDKQVSPASNNIQRPDKSVLTPSDNKEQPEKTVLSASDNEKQADQPVSTASPSRNEPVITTEQLSTSSACQDSGMDTSAATSHPTQQVYTEQLESDETDSPVTLITVKLEKMCIASHTGGIQ
ncbi:uncharacterized protein LOC131355579 isoform X2 [Hemibagrus wyckioides]|uniref:uncharacterized protein LOC131355579 isoform X2 n=1 Tax=Hemibagrus wyckioides TaxID=337641 RepID=UPI00266BAEB6|nr:uncharacterized protein LOC131355579 isoform X2 [Hemibagrus wyckioides]